MGKKQIDEQQICEIAENAFKRHFSDFEIVRVDVEPALDHDGDKVVDVNIYCDSKNRLARGPGLSRVQSEIASKAPASCAIFPSQDLKVSGVIPA